MRYVHRKWILKRRRVVTFDDAHWVSWLRMHGDRRMLWVKWLWGQVQWDGTGAQWDHTTPKCPICPLHHSTTVHKRLIHCMRWKVPFRSMWLSTWGPWQDTVTERWNRVSAEDLHHVSCLGIPHSLWDHIPRTLRRDLRERVAWHQYHALHGVCQLRDQLTIPPPTTNRCRPRPPQRCRHGTQSCAHELYDRTPWTLSSAIKYGIQGPGREHGGEIPAPLKRRPMVELCAHGTGRSRTTPGNGRQNIWTTAADPGAQVASAMQYLAQPWFLHHHAVLRASLMVSYRDVLDDPVRQSRHWHSLLRPARVWSTSADQLYQRHNRRIQLFLVMSQLWASERAAHRVESSLPKCHCCTRPGIPGQRPPPYMAPTKRRKLFTLEDLWGMAHT